MAVHAEAHPAELPLEVFLAAAPQVAAWVAEQGLETVRDLAYAFTDSAQAAACGCDGLPEAWTQARRDPRHLWVPAERSLLRHERAARIVAGAAHRATVGGLPRPSAQRRGGRTESESHQQDLLRRGAAALRAWNLALEWGTRGVFGRKLSGSSGLAREQLKAVTLRRLARFDPAS